MFQSKWKCLIAVKGSLELVHGRSRTESRRRFVEDAEVILGSRRDRRWLCRVIVVYGRGADSRDGMVWIMAENVSVLPTACMMLYQRTLHPTRVQHQLILNHAYVPMVTILSSSQPVALDSHLKTFYGILFLLDQLCSIL